MSSATPVARCPCGYLFDRATHIENPAEKPSEGDLSVCFECGRALRFGEDLRPVALTQPEIDALDEGWRAALARAQRAVANFRKLHPAKVKS